MSGKPAARQGDATMYGGPIVQGSAGVFIGAPTGVACSVCPGGMTSGHPVNPLLGAKVLPGETDFALPGPLPFVLSRTYSSYQTKTPAPVGQFGFGWKIAADMRLQISDNGLILNDNGGRSIQFEPLMPGEEAYSRSESFWLVRGGTTELSECSPLHGLWQALPEKLRSSPHIYLATNSAQGPRWILGWSERVPGENETLPAPLPPFRILTGLADRYGHSLTYHRDADGEFTGQVTAVTDGAGRQFRLILSTQEQRAEEVRDQQFSETLPEMAYGADEGIRLSSVWLVSEPAVPEDEQQPVMLAHYDYTHCGELAAVYDRGGVQVRHFTYDPLYPGRMTGHRYGGRPWMHYRYDSAGRVTEQLNPEGLSYRYQYESSKVTITDSLNRREVLHTEGEGGLKRVVKKEYADGTMTHSQYDPAGRLTAQTDAAGRRTEYRLHVASGRVTAATGHDGRQMRYGYNSRQQLTSTTYPDGLRSSREYDDLGRLKAESSRTGATTRYRYDNPQSELPSSVGDATGSRTMTWSRYGQLLTFTDCSGYETRYEYDRFGQQTAVHHEEGISMYRRYDSRGRLTAVTDSEGRETRYDHNDAGDLIAVTGPDGSRVADRDTYPLLPEVWHDNRITQDADYFYRYDEYGRLKEKDEHPVRSGDSHVHYYDYDTQHRLTHYRLMQGDDTLTESRYGYDPLGRRICKRVWGNHCGYSDIPGQEYPDNIPAVTWYGWDGDRLTTMQTDTTRIQTIYQPGSFTPLIRVETAKTELEKMHHRSLAEVLQQEGGGDGQRVVFPPELRAMLDRLEREIRLSAVSDESRQWLAGCGLTVTQMEDRLEAEYEPQRQVHLYHCDHRGLPLALTDADGHIAWRAEFDAWGNMLREDNPDNLQQLIRLPGQQYDEESGLYYNRHRYFNPTQGRYITQDPIGLEGGWNLYQYPLDPLSKIDPMGLMAFGGEFGKWTGSAANAASEGYMSYDGATAAIDAANGPTYSPLLFSLSLDIGASAYGITGGSLAAGIITGNNDKGLDLCAYAMACQGVGIGAAGGISISGTVTNAPPTSGSSYYRGVTTNVGFIANGAITTLTELNGTDDPTHVSTTLSGGVGGGDFSGAITCQQYTKCIEN